MCGIAGWIGVVPDASRVGEEVARRLAHRGPDASGRRIWPDASLLFRRLSILDLSDSGSQPMSNEDGTVWTIFNGEIYNHHEIRGWLEGRGHVFRGSCDAEVVPHLYEEVGADFAQRLRGMFALAIYDVPRRRLLLARDRFGIKPLFFAPGPRQLAFASEINALRAVPDVNWTPDAQAVSDFAALDFIPAPATLYAGVRCLEPGHVLEASLSDGRLSHSLRAYHRWEIATDSSLTREGAAERAANLISGAVEDQLESDVPLGTLLSGGIDSSLVSRAAQRATPAGIRSFSVRFADRAHDETAAALAVASRIGSTHTVIEVPREEGTWESVTGLLRHAGQPFADTSLFPVRAVCRAMRREVTVALSGDGGDEAFGGYNLFGQLPLIERYRTLPGGLRRIAGAALDPLARAGLIRRSLPSRAAELDQADDVSVVESLYSWLRPGEHRRLLGEASLLPPRRHFERRWNHALPEGASGTEALSALATEVGLRLVLPNDYLFKVDLASMRESLEVRVPLLDERVVAFGLTLPHRLKVSGRKGKRVLRDVAARWFPQEVSERPKQGFGMPVASWVDGEFRTALRETVLAPSSRLAGVFDPSVYGPWVESFCAGRQNGVSSQALAQRVTMLLALHLSLHGEA